jgi:DNA recombination protein RmuC
VTFDSGIFVLVFSFLAAVLAAWAAFRPLNVSHQLESFGREIGKTISEEMSRNRRDADQYGRMLREETSQSITGGLTSIIQSSQALRQEVANQIRAFGEAIGGSLSMLGQSQAERLESVVQHVRSLGDANERRLVEMRTEVAAQLQALGTVLTQNLSSLKDENSAKLEEMRRTVDEKLQNTLDQRLSTNFKMVSDGLEQVSNSVRDMQTLAAGVGVL